MELRDVPHGCWSSPLSAQALVRPSRRSAEIHVDGATCWWSETRPDQGGRTQVVRYGAPDQEDDVLPEGFDARTLVHEYGGGSWTVHRGTVVFSNLADQRVYRLAPGASTPVAISPVPQVDRGWRYGDLRVVEGGPWAGGAWVLAVREDHHPPAATARAEAVNEIVAMPLAGTAAEDPDAVAVLVTGSDFVASPAAHGDRLAWVGWQHPDMPWDNTSLWVARVRSHGAGLELGEPHRVAGGTNDTPESVMQPRWSPEGHLWFVSDRSNWWNLHRWDGREVTHVAPVDAELGLPAWTLGNRTFDFLTDGRIVTVMTRGGLGGMALVDPREPHRPPRHLDCGVTSVQQVAALPDGDVLAVAGGPALPFTVVRVSPDGDLDVLASPADDGLDTRWWSHGRPFEYPSAEGRVAHAVFYPPTNPEVTPPSGGRPPLVVVLHGGPTGQTDTALRPSVQYWTTRGFAVADLDYTGSTGYGRDYRRALHARWGIVDVEDCLAVVGHLAEQGLVDPARAAIRGGSAGGFTTLAVLTHPRNVFATGASYYGVADLATFARDTHKFESRYLDQLLGPLPESAQVYHERSPLTHVDRLSVPLVVFQGAEDPVVPPEQSRVIVGAVRAKGLECEYVEFPGEQHGFRRSESIVRAAETELAFYRRVMGLDDR